MLERAIMGREFQHRIEAAEHASLCLVLVEGQAGIGGSHVAVLLSMPLPDRSAESNDHATCVLGGLVCQNSQTEVQ
eukprot:6408922-Alexandrium_andersonii.AAC.1